MAVAGQWRIVYVHRVGTHGVHRIVHVDGVHCRRQGVTRAPQRCHAGTVACHPTDGVHGRAHRSHATIATSSTHVVALHGHVLWLQSARCSWEAGTVFRPEPRQGQPRDVVRAEGSYPGLSPVATSSVCTCGSGTRFSPVSVSASEWKLNVHVQVPTGSAADGTFFPVHKSAPWRTGLVASFSFLWLLPRLLILPWSPWCCCYSQISLT